jgi:hypothetical protein
MPDDLSAAGFPKLTWNNQKDAETLASLRDYVVQQAEEAANWYTRHRQWKRFWGRTIRLAALALTTAAGIIPMLSQMFATDGKPVIPPAWASILLAIAAGLVGLDYFFGFTTAWMRYMETQLKIAAALREFQFDWETLRAEWGGAQPTAAQVLPAITRLKQTALQVQQLVQDETNTWIAEFRTNLRMIDEAARAKIETSEGAAVNIVVVNGSQVTGDWSLRVDDGAKTMHRGERTSLVNLTPGTHRFSARGTIQGNERHDELSAVLPAKEVSEVRLELK